MSVEIYSSARRRLLEIWDYTFEKWGEQQADKYVRRLVKAINAASQQRYLWRAMPYSVARQVHFIRFEHHYIFFRELSDGTLGVISVLHESMNIPLRLKEDFQSSEGE